MTTESKINPDLQKDRHTRTFNVEELAEILSGGAEKRERRKKIAAVVKAERGFEGPDLSFLSRMERFEEGMRKSALVLKMRDQLGDLLCDADDFEYFNTIVAKGSVNVFTATHEVMFVPALQSQATEKQQAKWLVPAIKHEIIGTYSQTELGHGTYVRGIETTAHYKVETEEFVLNSPTITSIKWWPGAMGKTSTHAVVMAQLYTRGVCHGLHSFVVQLRSLEDHRSLPGITLGGIGPKFGCNETDNGYLILDHVHIPRENMLMKHAQVLPNGTYMKAPVKQLTYGTMTLVRTYLVQYSTHFLSSACTIAIRYGAVRRQSEMRPGEPEPQVLDYPTQQYKLFPLLAASYAFFFAQKKLVKIYNEVNGAIESGDYTGMKELHSVTSGLKAFITEIVNSGIEVCRMSCGGHGYSMASGLPQLYVRFTPLCTVEGVNTVLLLQTARFLIKCVREPGTHGSSVAYLRRENYRVQRRFNLNDLEVVCQLYEQRARALVRFTAGKVDEEIRRGEDLVGALNKVSVHSVRAANAHCHYYVMKVFVDEINTMTLSSSLKAVLTDLAKLYALDGIAKNSGEFMEENLLTAEDAKVCHQMVVDLLPKIRPNAVSLVDAFEHSDDTLMSVLGRYDGNVYENLLKWAMQSDFNKTDVIPAYHKHIRPLMKRFQSNL